MSRVNIAWEMQQHAIARSNVFDFGAAFEFRIGSVTMANGTAYTAKTLGGGTSASPLSSVTPDNKFVEFRCKTTAPSGDNRLMYLRYQMNGGGGGECLRAFTKLDSAVAVARGAQISLDIDDSPAGSVTGLGVGLEGQLLVGDAALPAGGNYFAGQSQIYCAGSSSDVGAPSFVAIHSFVAAGDSTGVATVLNAMAFSGSAGSGKMIYNNTGTDPTNSNGSIRILVDEGSGYVVRYLMYYDQQAA